MFRLRAFLFFQAVLWGQTGRVSQRGELIICHFGLKRVEVDVKMFRSHALGRTGCVSNHDGTIVDQNNSSGVSISVLAQRRSGAAALFPPVSQVTSLRSVFLCQSYNDYMRDYHHNVGPPAPWQTLASTSLTGPV